MPSLLFDFNGWQPAGLCSAVSSHNKGGLVGVVVSILAAAANAPGWQNRAIVGVHSICVKHKPLFHWMVPKAMVDNRLATTRHCRSLQKKLQVNLELVQIVCLLVSSNHMQRKAMVYSIRADDWAGRYDMMSNNGAQNARTGKAQARFIVLANVLNTSQEQEEIGSSGCTRVCVLFIFFSSCLGLSLNRTQEQ